MPEKVYGAQVPFTGSHSINLTDVNAVGVTFGFSAVQTVAHYVDAALVNAFKSADMADLATAIQNAGVTADYIRISWNEALQPTENYLIDSFQVGVVVTAYPTAVKASDLLLRLNQVSWYSTFASPLLYGNPFIAYVLDACQEGFHYDAATQSCVHDPCDVGWHWNGTVCVQDAPTNCLIGTHWDETLQRCVLNSCGEGYVWDNAKKACVLIQEPVPWIYLAAIGGAGVGLLGLWYWKFRA